MKRFENARVGDLVYCRKLGASSIVSIDKDSEYPIRISRMGTKYTIEGRYDKRDIEPILFYRSDTDNYLSERPKEVHINQWIIDRLDDLVNRIPYLIKEFDVRTALRYILIELKEDIEKNEI